MGFTRWLLRPRDKQVLWRADSCQGLYLHSVVISGGGSGGVFRVMSSEVLAIEAHSYWNEFQALESCGMRTKLASSERRQ